MNTRRTRSLVGALVVLATLTVGLSQLLRSSTTPVPAFVAHSLGAPLKSASATRQISADVSLGNDGGLVFGSGRDHLTLTSADSGSSSGWSRYAKGAARSTSFGNEVVVTKPNAAEQLLTVGRHHGKHTWTWRLSSNLGYPRVGDDGYVAFIKGHLISQAIQIKPVEIYDAAGRSITPKQSKSKS